MEVIYWLQKNLLLKAELPVWVYLVLDEKCLLDWFNSWCYEGHITLSRLSCDSCWPQLWRLHFSHCLYTQPLCFYSSAVSRLFPSDTVRLVLFVIFKYLPASYFILSRAVLHPYHLLQLISFWFSSICLLKEVLKCCKSRFSNTFLFLSIASFFLSQVWMSLHWPIQDETLRVLSTTKSCKKWIVTDCTQLDVSKGFFYSNLLATKFTVNYNLILNKIQFISILL